MAAKQRCAQGCKTGCSWLWGAFSSAVLEYDTAKIVHIKNKKVGLVNRLVQIVIFAYIIVWGIIIQKGYETTGSVQGTVTTKLKGAAVYTGNMSFMDNCRQPDWILFDVADFVVPPQEPNSFFVATNLWMTCDQRYGLCTERTDPHNCTKPADCEPAGTVFPGSSGATTGVCNTTVGSCELQSWCPTEDEDDDFTKLGPKVNAENFTVLVKNSIQFPSLLSERKRNILQTSDSDYLKTCRFHSSTKRGLYCPIFSLKQIVDMIHPKENFTLLSTFGGVIGLEIRWDCDNLEWGLGHCDPHYSAKRLDDRHVKLSPGYNFRYAKYYSDPSTGEQYRTLIKAYGILFKVQVVGRGGKFDFFTLVIKIGSGIALLAVATVVSDIVVLYVLKSRHFYRKKKYLNVVNPPMDDYEVINHSDTDATQENTPFANHDT